MSLQKIFKEVKNHNSNKIFSKKGYEPLYTASRMAKIVIIGQAPGKKAQDTGIVWNDLSGDKLRLWLGIDRKGFYNKKIISLLPMDFYYPGKGKSGDLPPRKEFAPMWHERILKEMPEVKLIILIGQYSQKYYLKDRVQKNLTETVRNYKKYLPTYFVLVHPSPLNARWQAKNRWFEKKVIPALKKKVAMVLK